MLLKALLGVLMVCIALAVWVRTKPEPTPAPLTTPPPELVTSQPPPEPADGGNGAVAAASGPRAVKIDPLDDTQVTQLEAELSSWLHGEVECIQEVSGEDATIDCTNQLGPLALRVKDPDGPVFFVFYANLTKIISLA